MRKDTIGFLNKLNEAEKPTRIKITKNNMREIPVEKGSIKATPSIQREMNNKKSLKEDSYNEPFFQAIESALEDAGFDVRRFTDAGIMTKNIGWEVSNSDGRVQLNCNGTWLDDEDDLDESQKLEEKRNPENDEANELIRNSLNNDEYAKNHVSELRKHGIKYIPPEKDWQGGALEGKQGRRLAVSTSDWRKDDIRNATNNSSSGDAYSNNYSYKDSSADKDDLHQKTYATSKAEVKNAKKNIGRQTTKVTNMEKKDKEAGLGWNEKTYKARETLADYKRTLDRGVTSSYKDTDKIHPDADLKGFLNAKKHSDRDLPREKDPKYQRWGGKVADPANKDVEDYKDLKARKSDISREKERNKNYDKEDQERIEDMKKRAKEEKKRRDSFVKSAEKEANKLDNRINSKLDAFRKRMNRQ